jgi:Kef-type K+ transport system membrane component KefB
MRCASPTGARPRRDAAARLGAVSLLFMVALVGLHLSPGPLAAHGQAVTGALTVVLAVAPVLAVALPTLGLPTVSAVTGGDDVALAWRRWG